ncbi:MAG: hypothetical protein ACRYG7_08705 [Janthinobacterium lividum]
MTKHTTFYSNELAAPTFTAELPAPYLWFDTQVGLADDLSSWRARVGDYTAYQPDHNRRFLRPTDRHPNWLITDSGRGMQIPEVHLSHAQAFTVLTQIAIDDPGLEGQAILVYPSGVFYSYHGNVEFYIREGNAGCNPTARISPGDFTVAGGDAVVGSYPCSRSFVEKNLQFGYNRYGGMNSILDGEWTIGTATGASGFGGRIKGFTVFDFQLSDTQRNAWVDYLTTH